MASKLKYSPISKLRSKKLFDLRTIEGQVCNSELAWRKNYIKKAIEKFIFQIIQRYAALGTNACCQPYQVIAKEAKCTRSYINRIIKKLNNVLVDGNPLIKIYTRRNKDGGFATNLLVPLNISNGEYANFSLELLNPKKKTQHWAD